MPDQQGTAELPLRIWDAPGGAVIRCLCGAEAAVMRPSIMAQWKGQADPSAAGLLRMQLHAQRCLIGKSLAADLHARVPHFAGSGTAAERPPS
jgi:hypothetical protein